MTSTPSKPRWDGPRLLDLFLLVLGLPIWAPVLAAVAATIRVFDGPPVLFRQDRSGRGGIAFEILKFRTMIRDADSYLDADGRPTRDRVTSIGRLLRRTGVDELPQVLNVVRGEMSLVGPRPVLPDRVSRIPGGTEHPRFTVPPGLTGPAQVAGRNQVLWSKRLDLETDYVHRRSVWTNLRWILATPLALTRPTVAADRNPEAVDDLGR